MSIDRDESTQEPVSPSTADSCLVSTFVLPQEHDDLVRGAYFGPAEDIKLLMQELEDSNARGLSSWELVPTWVIGIVIEGYAKSGCRTFLVSHSGYRDGNPLFDITEVSLPRESVRWWVIPLWMARVLRLPGASHQDDCTEYNLRGRA